MADRPLTVADRAPQVGDVLFVDGSEAKVIGFHRPADIYRLLYSGGSQDIWSGDALRKYVAEFRYRADRGPVTVTESACLSGPEPGAGAEC